MGELFGLYHEALVTWQMALLSFLVAFLLSSVIAKTYQLTYEGLSWSKSLTQALVLGSLVTCLIMMAVGDNIARGIGIVGSLAIIRFRTNLRDPRDIVFVFAALGTGVAVGVQSYIVAITGTMTFCLIAIVLKINNVGTLRHHQGYLRFQLPANSDAITSVGEVLRKTTRRCALITMRQVAQGQLVDYTYQVFLKEPNKAEGLLKELEQISSIAGLKYMSHETTVEI